MDHRKTKSCHCKIDYCFMMFDRFLRWIEMMLVKHKRKILLVYLLITSCVLLYTVNFALKVASFAVQIPPTDLQYVLDSISRDGDSMLHFAKIVHRQSVANSIFSDFLHIVPEMLFCVFLSALGLIARNGRIPCFLRLTSGGIHWSWWMGLYFIAVITMGLIVSETMLYFTTSNEIVASDRSLCEMFSVNPADAIAIMYARRRLLLGSSLMHSVALIGIVSLIMTIPLIRIIWVERYVCRKKKCLT